MKTNISSRRVPVPQALREFARTRLERALGRVAWAVDRVDIRLSDENGPRPGGYACKLVVTPAGGGRTVVVREARDDVFAAVAAAARRAGLGVVRSISRLRRRRR